MLNLILATLFAANANYTYERQDAPTDSQIYRGAPYKISFVLPAYCYPCALAITDPASTDPYQPLQVTGDIHDTGSFILTLQPSKDRMDARVLITLTYGNQNLNMEILPAKTVAGIRRQNHIPTFHLKTTHYLVNGRTSR